MDDISDKILSALRQLSSNPDATFREGQREAIEILIGRKRLLLVQRTGWGKSAVYFVATKLLREQGLGPTLLISPLLALMRNQISAAERLGLRSFTINSSAESTVDELILALRSNAIDVVDSRWTMTEIGRVLRRGGCAAVIPVALASSSS